ncbi:Fibroleukin [Pseudolycoriella hygida]|uniref:Fibroleukin n=1 Tax=Pseudolycoriella hygida TaxID=35572 RepID=A0A9Q0ML95_9DIPT|nr:Fibroleukin [Pseudolycoriella hygida]
MEVPSVLLSIVILTSLFFPSMWCLDGDSLLSDIRNDEPSLTGRNAFHFTPVEQTQELDMEDCDQLLDPNDNLNYQPSYLRFMKCKLDSLIESNRNIVRAINALELKTNRIVMAAGAVNERSSTKNYDLMDSLEMTNKLNNIEQHITSLDQNCLSKQSNELEPREYEMIKDFVSATDCDKCSRRQTVEVLANSRQTVQYLEKLSSAVERICKMTDRKRICRRSSSSIKNKTDKWRNQGLNVERYENTYRNIRRDLNQVTFEPNKFNCHDLQLRINGTYKFGSLDEVSNEAGRFFYERYCDFNTDGGAWTVIQKRFVNDQQENFNRSWLDYKLGFGDLNKEFWFGNDFIHRLTSHEDVELRIVVEDTTGRTDWAQYTLFKVDSEEYNYNLVIGGYKGSIPDAFPTNNDHEFSTYDRQNDNDTDESEWWFNNYTDISHQNYKGNIWKKWLGNKAFKSSKMMIRPRGLWANKDSEVEGYVHTSNSVDL